MRANKRLGDCETEEEKETRMGQQEELTCVYYYISTSSISPSHLCVRVSVYLSSSLLRCIRRMFRKRKLYPYTILSLSVFSVCSQDDVSLNLALISCSFSLSLLVFLSLKLIPICVYKDRPVSQCLWLLQCLLLINVTLISNVRRKQEKMRMKGC